MDFICFKLLILLILLLKCKTLNLPKKCQAQGCIKSANKKGLQNGYISMSKVSINIYKLNILYL